MGHATRCADLIQKLQANNTITIAVTERTQLYFDKVFPNLKKVMLPSYRITYSSFLPVWLKVLLQTRKIKSVIVAESLAVEALQKQHKFDVIISDNRFGVLHPSASNYVITHQLTIQTPIFSKLANRINQNYLNKFEHILVPDFAENGKCLAGKLSRNNFFKNKVTYIGPLSHLNLIPKTESTEKIKCLVILSGPEPQRSIFEKEIIGLLDRPETATVLVRGSSTKNSTATSHIKIINEANNGELKKLIQSAELIICRSGYSTLMDLYFMQHTNLILVPTPGQTEQEYLADFWQKKIGALQLQQHQLKKHLAASIKTRLHLAR